MAFGNNLFRTDVDSAYRTLEITNRNAPDQLVWQYYVHGGSVNIGAVYTIAMDRKSKFLLSHIDPSLVPGGTRTCKLYHLFILHSQLLPQLTLSKMQALTIGYSGE